MSMFEASSLVLFFPWVRGMSSVEELHISSESVVSSSSKSLPSESSYRDLFLVQREDIGRIKIVVKGEKYNYNRSMQLSSIYISKLIGKVTFVGNILRVNTRND